MTEITESEWDVMRIVWTIGPVSSHDIIQALNDKHDWKPATVKTLIGRLVKKGALTTQSEGRRNLYEALLAEKATSHQKIIDDFDEICAMHHGDALMAVLKHVTLSKDDIAQLQAQLTSMQASAPETVACNCMAQMGGMTHES